MVCGTAANRFVVLNGNYQTMHFRSLYRETVIKYCTALLLSVLCNICNTLLLWSNDPKTDPNKKKKMKYLKIPKKIIIIIIFDHKAYN